MTYDVAVIGGGLAGVATAARLQAQGFSTIVFEEHTHLGGCAGYFRRRGFSFDVGATTLVDFEPGGVGGDFLKSIGMSPVAGESLPGYVAWLPDRTVTLHRDAAQWGAERLAAFGDTSAHRALWHLLDELATTFWAASRSGIKLPFRSVADLLHAAEKLGLNHLLLARYIRWTMGDALRHFNLRGDQPLATLLGMLIEDTVHSTVDDAPLINAALGITIRGAGLMRHNGGMYGFWRRLTQHYRALGGEIRVGCHVESVEGRLNDFTVHTTRGDFEARQVVSAVPAPLTSRIIPALNAPLRPYIQRDNAALGGAVVMFLGVPESEVDNHAFTHHQLFQDYNQPFGDGNNMFISVSAPSDVQSAPHGYRAVMISTHCDLENWAHLSEVDYAAHKAAIGQRLLTYARRVYSNLGERARVFEIGTPRTYAAFTSRPNGAVGGVRQTLTNSNQHAIPHDLGPRGLWMVGDTTWPGLGTVACVLGSRIVAEGAARLGRRLNPQPIRKARLVLETR